MVVFRQNLWGRWITGNHTGMFASGVFAPFTICFGLLLPVVMLLPKRFPLAARISRIEIFPRIILASLVIFVAANVLLFRLYLPSRFTTNSFRIVLAMAGGITAVALLDGLFHLVGSRAGRVAATVLFAGVLALPLAMGPIVDTRYKTGTNPGLYEYLASQPKNILIASLADETNNLPIFAKRSVLFSRETALPFHKRYYNQVRERVLDLINAQYTDDLAELQSFIKKYAVDYLLVDLDAFAPEYVSRDKWITQYQPAAGESVARLKQGARPILADLMSSCSSYQSDEMVLISGECVMKATPTHQTAGIR